MNIAVLIARFQTPELVKEQIQLIKKLNEQYDKLLIVLGDSPLPKTRVNPYDYNTRSNMIHEHFPEMPVLRFKDHPVDAIWSKNLDDLLIESFSSSDLSLFGSKDRFIPHYTGKFKTVSLDNHYDCDTQKVKDAFSNTAADSKEFREGILYAVHNQ